MLHARGIVGTRNPSNEALVEAFRLTVALPRSGIEIDSAEFGFGSIL